MQLITIRVSRLSVSLGVSPERATQWLWNEYVREEDNLPTGKDPQDAFPAKGKGRRW